MGVRSTGNFPTTTKADGHLSEYFRQTFGAGGGGTNAPPGALGISATGGTTSSYGPPTGRYQVHTFTSSGDFIVNSLGNIDNTINYFVLSGGGGSGWGSSSRGGGGGGGGGVKSGTGVPVSAATYPIVVGGGGAPALNSPRTAGGAGGPSYITHPEGPYRAQGGGGGGSYPSSPPTAAAQPGGSGGGAEAENNTAGFGYNPSTPGPILGAVPAPTGGPLGSAPYGFTQGYPGGTANADESGGGGGAGGAGGNALSSNYGGAGGNGTTVTITGSPQTYGGGGGGGARGTPGNSAVGGNPGPGGGGAGASGSSHGTNGQPNRGGGGGGPGGWGNDAKSGGSGIVIISYQIAPPV